MNESVNKSGASPLSSQLNRLETLINKNTEYSKSIRETTHLGRQFTLGLSKIANHVMIAKTILSIFSEIKDKNIKFEVRKLVEKNIESKEAGNWIRLGKEMLELRSLLKAEGIPSQQEFIPHLDLKPEVNIGKYNEENADKILTPKEFVNSLITVSYKTSDALQHQLNRDLTNRSEIPFISSGDEQKLRFKVSDRNSSPNETGESTVNETVKSSGADLDKVFPEEFKDKFTQEEQQCIVALSLVVATSSSFSIIHHEIMNLNERTGRDYSYAASNKREDATARINIEGEEKTFETSVKYQVVSTEPDGYVGSITFKYTYDLNDLNKLPTLTQHYQPYDQLIQL